jgi:sugar O-acyltransferase (sialic acid O-acetyltransferase NeuD family)
MKEKIILIGGGGHCKACIDVIEQAGVFQIAGIVDMTEKMHQKIFGYEIIATDSNLPDLPKKYSHFLITLGQVKSPDRRIELFETLKSLGAYFPTILSPHAYISKHAQIGEGTIVMHHALINAGAKIGNNCIINNKALIEHDAIIGNHCHIATGAVINGGVRVGSGTFFGSNSVTKEFIDIGRNSIIGCGAKIIKNVPPNSLSFDH